MSSYGIEVEIKRPICFFIHTVEIFQKSDTSSPVKISEILINPLIKIGPTRREENTALYKIIHIILDHLASLKNRHFPQIEDTLKAQESSTRLNKSTINFFSAPNTVPFNFANFSPELIQFILNNIQFSLDHANVSDEFVMIPELVTYPIGRFHGYSQKVFRDQIKFLELFFKFCSTLGSQREESKLPCSIQWHDPSTWHVDDQANHPWNYLLTLKGECILQGQPKHFSRSDRKSWGGLYPQYNFSIDLTNFLFHTHNTMAISVPNLSLDPMLYLYQLSAKSDIFQDKDSYLIPYNLSLLNLSRQIINNMSHASTSWIEYNNISRYWIDGAFGFTIWYFLSLCVGGLEGDGLYKNIFLFIPKTSPIPFLKAAYHTNPEYYESLIVHFIPAFINALTIYSQTPQMPTHFFKFLKMEWFFPLISQWFDAGSSKVKLITEISTPTQSQIRYSNPISEELPKEIHHLHHVILFLGGQYLSPITHEKNAENKGVLSVLIKLMCLSFMGPSVRYNFAIKQQGGELSDALTVIGKLLDASSASRLPVYAQPGFGRPKLEARMIYNPPTDLKEIAELVTTLNSLGRPRVTLPPVEFTHDIKSPSDQQSVDLSIKMRNDIVRHAVDPWENEEYRAVWIPGQQEFGRRKQDDVRRWLQQQTSPDPELTRIPAVVAPPHQIIPLVRQHSISSSHTIPLDQILQPTKEQLDAVINKLDPFKGFENFDDFDD